MSLLPTAVACFDESGKFKGTDVVAVGGCVAMPETLRQITKQWDERLTVERIPFTSMKDAVHLHAHFASWKDSRRDEFLWDLANIITDAPMMRVYTTIRTATFKAMAQEQRKRLGNDPHYASMEGCIRAALDADRIHLQVICDLSEEYSEECLRLYLKIMRRQSEAKARCVGISFQDDEVNPGIQIADMIAYCHRADATRDTVTPPPVVDKIITLFKSQDRQMGHALYSTEGKGLGDGRIELGPIENAV
jgi:hypothetical protein